MELVGEGVDDGTRRSAAICSSRSWPKVRQTIAATCRSSTRAVSAIGSRGRAGQAAVDDERVAAELGDAAANETRVRSDGLSKTTATARGPVQGRGARAARPSAWRPGRGRRAARRGQVVVAQEVAGMSGPPGRVGGRSAVGWRAASRPGSAARNESSSSAVRTSGGASRIASGATGLTMKPRLAGHRRDLAATGAGQARSRAAGPAPRTPVTSGWPSAGDGLDEALALPRGRGRAAPRSSMVASTASPAAAANGLPPNVVPCWPAASRPGDLGPEGRPARRSGTPRRAPWPA